MTPPGLLKIKQTADLLQASEAWIYKAVREGRIPVTRVGRSLRFDPRALERFGTGRRSPS